MISVIEVKIPSESAVGATAYTLRTLTVAILRKVLSPNQPKAWLISREGAFLEKAVGLEVLTQTAYPHPHSALWQRVDQSFLRTASNCFWPGLWFRVQGLCLVVKVSALGFRV